MRRTILNLSQEELASRAELSPGFVANLETGRNFPSSKAILKIATALKIEPWKLFVDPQKQDLFFSRDEVVQWLEDSRKRLFGNQPRSIYDIDNEVQTKNNNKGNEHVASP
jgi:transcriptional regulator with XRE-family HTH domain